MGRVMNSFCSHIGLSQEHSRTRHFSRRYEAISRRERREGKAEVRIPHQQTILQNKISTSMKRGPLLV
jgi:hypothetical protein